MELIPWGVIIFLGIIFLSSYHKYKNFIHPSVVVSLVWFILLFSYNFFEHRLFPLTLQFYAAITLWVVSFCFASCYLQYKTIKIPGIIANSRIKPQITKFLLTFFIFVNIFGCYKFYQISGGKLAYHILSAMNHGNEEMPPIVRALQALQVLSMALFTALCLFWKEIKFNRWLVALYTLTLLAWSTITANKSGLFQLFFIIFCVLYLKNKLSLKKLAIGIISALTILLTVQSARIINKHEDKLSTEELTLIYILSPLPAYDAVLNGEKVFSEGKTTRFFRAVGSSLKICEPPRKERTSSWIYVPVQTNVYTVMFPFFVDFGFWGILFFGLFEGWLWGFMYQRMMRHNAFFTLMFITFGYTLLLQFFADYIFNYMSVFFQAAILIGVITCNLKNE